MLMFEEQLLVDIPDSFQEMEKIKIDMLYPYDEKPQIILEDKEHRFCTFSLLENQILTDSQVESAIQTILKVVTSLYPSSLLEEPQLMNCRGGTYGWISFRTAAAEGEIFNVMYIFSVNGCMMLGTMGCLAEDESGKKQMFEIMESLRNLRKKFSYAISGRAQYSQKNERDRGKTM